MLVAALAAAAVHAAPLPEREQIGPWTIIRKVDPITDVKTVSFVVGDVYNNWGIACRAHEPQTVTVQWRGRERFLERLRTTEPYVPGVFLYRFDEDEPKYARTQLNNDRTVSSVLANEDVEAIISRFRSSMRLVLRDPAREGEVARTVAFQYQWEHAVIMVNLINTECGTTFGQAEPEPVP